METGAAATKQADPTPAHWEAGRGCRGPPEGKGCPIPPRGSPAQGSSSRRGGPTKSDCKTEWGLGDQGETEAWWKLTHPLKGPVHSRRACITRWRAERGRRLRRRQGHAGRGQAAWSLPPAGLEGRPRGSPSGQCASVQPSPAQLMPPCPLPGRTPHRQRGPHEAGAAREGL